MEVFSQKVILKKVIITPFSSLFPRNNPYDLVDIPPRYRTNEYLANADNSEVNVIVLNDVSELKLNSAPGATESKTIKPQYIKMNVSEEENIDTSISSLIESDTPALTAIDELLSVAQEAAEMPPEKREKLLEAGYSIGDAEEFLTDIQEPVVTEAPETTEQQEQPVKLNINTATLEEIEALPKVGAKTAKKVVALREESPFTSLEDLDSRATLPFGKSWTSLAEQIEVH